MLLFSYKIYDILRFIAFKKNCSIQSYYNEVFSASGLVIIMECIYKLLIVDTLLVELCKDTISCEETLAFPKRNLI